MSSSQDRRPTRRQDSRSDDRRNRLGDVVAVVWDARLRRPSSFFWRGRRYSVDRVLRTWVIATGWWRGERATDRSYWRLSARGRLFDLSFDRLSGQWRLERVLN